MPNDNTYDAVIVGAGLSGIAAAIRLGHFGKRVLVVERHHLPGGLNSYYRYHGRLVDTGLHAVTNFSRAGNRQAPLNRLLRQLRIPREALELCEQTQSTIRFPRAALRFTNTFSDLQQSIADTFPSQVDAFATLAEIVAQRDCFALDATAGSARELLQSCIQDPLLRNMILCPLMFYGNAMTHDMELNQFCILFKSLFLEGFARPKKGMRHVVDFLMRRLSDTGVETRFRCGVRRIAVRNGRAVRLELDDGSECEANTILSCAGYNETLALCDPELPAHTMAPDGVMSFVETVFFIDRSPAELGLQDAIQFVCDTPRFTYAPPTDPIDFGSAVVCVPENFLNCRGTYADGQVRVTHMADHNVWHRLENHDYQAAKLQAVSQQTKRLDGKYPGFADAVRDSDMFTPRTVTRFTGHRNGTVYGSPQKHKDGRTPLENLFVCGTDQGFLGIVGSLLSGISMANLHGLP